MRSQTDNVYAGDMSRIGNTAQRKCAANSLLSVDLDAHQNNASNAPTADRSGLPLRCPACSHPMQQQRSRFFVCTPCRQTIMTFEVAEHQYLSSRRLPLLSDGLTEELQAIGDETSVRSNRSTRTSIALGQLHQRFAKSSSCQRRTTTERNNGLDHPYQPACACVAAESSHNCTHVRGFNKHPLIFGGGRRNHNSQAFP